jgi:hypothetical protein
MKPGITREQLAVELTQLSKELPARCGEPPNYARFIEYDTGGRLGQLMFRINW